jgi:hypothetical protein
MLGKSTEELFGEKPENLHLIYVFPVPKQYDIPNVWILPK